MEEDLFARLARDLEDAGETDPERTVARWFERGRMVAGLSTPAPPELVQEIEAAGPPEAALYTRAAQLQTLWLVLAGATAECEQARAAGDAARAATMLRMVGVLTALSEEEAAAVNAALKAQTN